MYITGVTGVNNTIALRQGESVSVMKTAVKKATNATSCSAPCPRRPDE